MGRLLGVLIVVWFLIGVAAAYQRDYLSRPDTSCAEAGTVALAVAAGPLNYAGVNPKVDCADVDVPEPSSAVN